MTLIYAKGVPDIWRLHQQSANCKIEEDRLMASAQAGLPADGLPQAIGARINAENALRDAKQQAKSLTASVYTHALVIGVGEYPHLRGGGLFAAQPAAVGLGLGQLTSSVASAMAFTDWLLTSFRNDGKPIGTVELLLSPGAYRPSPDASAILGLASGPSMTVDSATSSNIRAAFDEWLDRCNGDRANIAIFYFSGHGLEKEVSLLLPEDFGIEVNRPFATCIDLTTTHRFMGQSKVGTQCFFIDACRETPIELLTSLEKPGFPLKGSTSGSFLERDAPIYQGAAEGRQAFGPSGKVSFFTEQLIRCLNGLGAQNKAGQKWRVTTQSLRTGLTTVIPRLPPVGGKRITCDCGNGKSNFPTDLHFAADPVPVLMNLTLDPMHAAADARLYMKDRSNNRTDRSNPDPSPWQLEVVSGWYIVGAEFSKVYQNVELDFDAAYPPEFTPVLSCSEQA